ncbi:putative C2H2-type domain-containing protein [Seiridium unicorne]|uniref:C2H2-type domain-containing protein n=1 Tax=Seiridium unicorne TaxID=138068 RepID=A0ABR2V6P0_9PEZI
MANIEFMKFNNAINGNSGKLTAICKQVAIAAWNDSKINEITKYNNKLVVYLVRRYIYTVAGGEIPENGWLKTATATSCFRTASPTGHGPLEVKDQPFVADVTRICPDANGTRCLHLDVQIVRRHVTNSTAQASSASHSILSRSELREHIKSTHGKRKSVGNRWPCDICDKDFSSKPCLRDHIKSVHEGKKSTCKICGKKFSGRNLRRHILIAHEGTKWSCETCRRDFKSKVDLQSHVQSVQEGNRVSCEICGKDYQGSHSLERHIGTVHEGVKYLCEICGKESTRPSQVTIHVQSAHEAKKWPCEICGENFSRQSYRQRHIKTIHEGRMRPCEICGKEFKDWIVLARHVEFLHNGKTKWRFIRDSIFEPSNSDFVIDIEGCNKICKAFELSVFRPDGSRIITTVMDWEMSKEDMCEGNQMSLHFAYKIYSHGRAGSMMKRGEIAKKLRDAGMDGNSNIFIWGWGVGHSLPSRAESHY